MITPDSVRKIESFVHIQPRSIDEISKFLGKNWRTADRYVKEIEMEYNTISTKVFRPGSRGAIKIVFWKGLENASHSVFQAKLEEALLAAKRKEDFSAFDIYQYVQDPKKSASVESEVSEAKTDIKLLADILNDTRKQLVIFSGNLSFINIKNRQYDIYALIDALVKRGVSIKVLCRVDFAAVHNVQKLLALNFKYGKEAIEIHHRDQPLRGLVSDGKIIRIKEVTEPTGKIHELNKKIFMFYTIKDNEWAQWLSRVFWKMFSSSIDAKKRIEELNKLDVRD